MPPQEGESQRRLAAVWFADIAGYTSLAAEDEEAAMGLVDAFQEVTREAVVRHGGNLVKFLGDGALAEFQSAEAAARAAAEIHQRFSSRSLPASTALRIGLHLGEVLVSPDGDVYGEGVNTASRLQGAAEPGQTLLSEDVWRQLRRRRGFEFAERGERRLKGVEEPIRVYELVAAPAPEVPAATAPAGGPGTAPSPIAPTGAPAIAAAGTPAAPTGAGPQGRARRWLRERPALAPVGLAALLLLGFFVIRRGLGPSGDSLEPTPEAPLSLAVTPFDEIGGDPESESFAEGMAIELIIRLAEIEDLRVISRNSSMRYKDTEKTARQIGEELGARAILQGAVQRSADRLRVIIQLVDAQTEEHLWAETYDRRLADVFDIQTDIAAQVARALEAELSADVGDPVAIAPPSGSLEAYDLYLRVRSFLARHTERDTRAAAQAFESALEIDPDYARAHAGLAMASAEMHLRFAPRGEAEGWGERALAEAGRALALESDLAEAHEAVAAIFRKTDFNWERVIAESRRALELNPSLADPHYYLAALYHLGLLEAAEREARTGMEIDPVGDRVDPLRTLGIVALFGGRYPEAAALLEEVRELSEGRLSDAYLATTYYYLGETERAERMLRELGQSSSPSASTRAKAALAGFLAARDEAEQARTILADVAAAEYRDHHVAYGLGVAYAQLDRPDEAVRWLREAAETGFPCYPLFESDPLLGPVREDDAFVEFMRGLRESWEAARARYGE